MNPTTIASNRTDVSRSFSHIVDAIATHMGKLNSIANTLANGKSAMPTTQQYCAER